MIEIPVYRPEVTVYRPAPDGGLDVAHGGPLTNTLFYAMPDEDGSTPREAGLRRVVRLGAEPAYRILAPDGSRLVEVGRALLLEVEGKRYDALSALIMAKTRGMGLDLVRPGRVDGARAAAPPPAPRPKCRALQLDLFGEDRAEAKP